MRLRLIPGFDFVHDRVQRVLPKAAKITTNQGAALLEGPKPEGPKWPEVQRQLSSPGRSGPQANRSGEPRLPSPVLTAIAAGELGPTGTSVTS
jgi:hypothetical protein